MMVSFKLNIIAVLFCCLPLQFSFILSFQPNPSLYTSKPLAIIVLRLIAKLYLLCSFFHLKTATLWADGARVVTIAICDVWSVQGPTIASAPSVELEDYRTPKPVVSDIKNGKSFDFGGAGANALNASDNNALLKVGVCEKKKDYSYYKWKISYSIWKETHMRWMPSDNYNIRWSNFLMRTMAKGGNSLHIFRFFENF